MNHRDSLGALLRIVKLTGAQVLVVALLSVGGAASAQNHQLLKAVYVDGDPVAPPPKDVVGTALVGTGLCAGFRLLDWNGPARDQIFQTRSAGYPADPTVVSAPADAINTLMDSTGAKYPATYNTLVTPFDLAAQMAQVGDPPGGDFLWTATPCVNGDSDGCLFPASGSNLSTVQYFATRFRGFILIPAGIAGQPFHIGFRSKTVVALRVFDRAARLYELISRAAGAGQPDYRVTNTITFTKPGLYPIEIVHANADSVAVLEMSVLFSSGYVDIDDVSDISQPLSLSMFTLDSPRPELSTGANRFFQTSTGTLPFAGHPDQCQQCPRQYANTPTQPADGSVCPPKMFCNEAAVCSPCVGDQFCGASCQNCANTPATPFCVLDPAKAEYQCGQCRADSDCSSGQKCVSNQCSDTGGGECFDGSCPPGGGMGCSSCSIGAARNLVAAKPGRDGLWGLVGALTLLGALRLRRSRAAASKRPAT